MSSVLPGKLQEVLDNTKLTVYGVSQIIGAETDEPLNTIQDRWRRWLKTPPKTWAAIEQDLTYLGYEIKIQKRGQS